MNIIPPVETVKRFAVHVQRLFGEEFKSALNYQKVGVELYQYQTNIVNCYLRSVRLNRCGHLAWNAPAGTPNECGI